MSEANPQRTHGRSVTAKKATAFPADGTPIRVPPMYGSFCHAGDHMDVWCFSMWFELQTYPLIGVRMITEWTFSLWHTSDPCGQWARDQAKAVFLRLENAQQTSQPQPPTPPPPLPPTPPTPPDPPPPEVDPDAAAIEKWEKEQGLAPSRLSIPHGTASAAGARCFDFRRIIKLRPDGTPASAQPADTTFFRGVAHDGLHAALRARVVTTRTHIDDRRLLEQTLVFSHREVLGLSDGPPPSDAEAERLWVERDRRRLQTALEWTPFALDADNTTDLETALRERARRDADPSERDEEIAALVQAYTSTLGTVLQAL